MLIGLHGRARSGKDTICQFIKDWGEQDHREVTRDAFADRLKLSAYRIFKPDCTLEEALEWSDQIKTAGCVAAETGDWIPYEITGREFLQNYGTEAHREVFGTDFWVDACLPDQYSYDDGITVITDVRFPNEAERIHALGGEVWAVIRDTGSEINESAHASEQSLPSDLIDHVITNNSTLGSLRDHVLSIMERKVYS